EEPPALGRRGCGERPLEELANDPEGERTLELGAARPQHPEPTVSGGRDPLGEEPRLPHSCPPLDEEEPPPLPLRERETLLDERELALALDEACDGGHLDVRHLELRS